MKNTARGTDMRRRMRWLRNEIMKESRIRTVDLQAVWKLVRHLDLHSKNASGNRSMTGDITAKELSVD